MKRALLAASLLVCTVASAQRLDPNAPIKAYASKVLPRCPGGTLTVEEADGGPKNFQTFAVAVRSADKYCGTQKYLLYSPKTQQVLVGAVVPLPADGRSAADRITAKSSEMLDRGLVRLAEHLRALRALGCRPDHREELGDARQAAQGHGRAVSAAGRAEGGQHRTRHAVRSVRLLRLSRRLRAIHDRRHARQHE